MQQCEGRMSLLLGRQPTLGTISVDVVEELRAVKELLGNLVDSASQLEDLLLELLGSEKAISQLAGISSKRKRKTMSAEDLEDEERKQDETTNLIVYYYQRAEMWRATAAKALESARALEESISVTLSVRRYEVNKLELLISIAAFAGETAVSVQRVSHHLP